MSAGSSITSGNRSKEIIFMLTFVSLVYKIRNVKSNDGAQ